MLRQCHLAQGFLLLAFIQPCLICVIAGRITRVCQGNVSVIETQSNTLSQEITHEFSYRVGLHSATPPVGPPWETLVSVVIQLSYGGPDHVTELQLSQSELSNAITKTGRVTVPAQGIVQVWQPIAEVQGSVFGFDYTAVKTETPRFEIPAHVVSCSATYNVRDLVTSSSRVRLRHNPTGQYMVLTNRKGWDAATLGYSRDHHFIIESIGSSVTRIYTLNNRFPGYIYAYSSTFGGIYFDESDSSNGKQKWKLSDPNPRDGDTVTIENVEYPGAYITYYDGWSTNVFCEYRSSPDTWTIELV